MIIDILVGIILLLVVRIYFIQDRVGRRLMILERIAGSNQSNRDMILRSKKWKT